MASKVQINTAWCKGCGFCVQTCPKKALSLTGSVNSSGYIPAVPNRELCNGCGLCYVVCPDCAITVNEEGDENNG